jgi:hypothetical protein
MISSTKQPRVNVVNALNQELERRSQVPHKDDPQEDEDYGKDKEEALENPEDGNDPEEAVEVDLENVPERSQAQSIVSTKSFAVKLRNEIEEEKRKREELEKQIEELKKFNKSITSKLGIQVKE